MVIRHTRSPFSPARALAALLALVLAALVLAAPSPADAAEIDLSAAGAPPGMPASVSVTRADGSLTASWPAVDGATSYHVTYSSDGKASWSLAALDHPADGNTNNGVTSITFDADNAKTYIVGVRAKNSAGGGGWRNSPASGPFTPPAPAPPGTPSSVSVTRADGSLTASWPAVDGAASYHVTYSDNGAQSWQLAALDHPAGGGATESITFDADNAKTYIVGVRAKNGAGGGAWRNSPASGPFTPPTPTPTPEPERGIVVQDADGNAVTALSIPEGGEASYRVKLLSQPSEDVEVCIGLSVRGNNDPDITFKGEASDVAAIKLTFTPENWNTAQTVTLAAAEDGDAVNGARDVTHDAREYYGGRVDWTATEADNDPPAAPSGLTAASGDGSVTLSWDDPSDASITGYEYRRNHNDTSTGNLSGWGPWTAISGSDAATASHAFTGLTNGAEYRFKLRAVNANGNSTPAPSGAPWYAAATPAAPTLTADGVTATGATITLGNWDGAWYYSASAASGGGASGAGAASGGGTCNGPVNGQQTTVTGLDPDTAYTITAYANGCGGGAIAAGQFATPASTVTLAASNVTYYGATITLTGHTGDWWYRQTAPGSGDCTKVFSPGTTKSFTRFEPGVAYTFKAYSDAACATEVTSDATDAEFTTSPVALSTPWHIVPEGRSETHTVRLGRQPTANVTVTVATSGDTDITAAPTTLTFTPSNWWAPQTVTLSAGQDTDTVPQAGKGDGAWAYGATTVTHTATSTDANFNNVSSVLDATEGDDDVCSGTTAVGGSGVTSGAIVEDCDTLLAAKSVINGTETTVDDWSTGTAMGSWVGVTVANSRVTELKMEMFLYAGTDGNTPNTIADLDALTHLEMQSGTPARRPGPMPRGIASLTGLTVLELYHRELTGQIPANIGDLTGLTSLVLDDNRLSGPLPASLGDLGSLTTLWLELNRFTGEIPAQLGNLTSLNLTLDQNLLTGCVPPGWSGYLSDINPQHDASGNDVTLPVCIGQPAKPTAAPKHQGAEVSWTAPSGRTPTGYEIQWRPCQVTYEATCRYKDSNGLWRPAWAPWGTGTWLHGSSGTVAVGASASPYTVTGLDNGVRYQLRVRGYDGTGHGPWSEPSDDVWPNTQYSLTASNVTGSEATLTVAVSSGGSWLYKAWHYKADRTPHTSCSGAQSATTVTVTGLTEHASYIYTAYTDSGCTDALASAAAFTPSGDDLTAGSITGTGATLTLAGHTGNWWLKRTQPADTTCEAMQTATTKDLTGLDHSTAYLYTAYSDSTCTTAIDSAAFTTLTPTLTASSVTTTTATLTIGNYTAQWYYEADKAPDNSCKGPVAANDATEDLTGLTAGAWYTYTAYSDASCSTANELAAEAFSTAVTVSSIDTNSNSNVFIGRSFGAPQGGAQAFTTGSNTGGYTLTSITGSFSHAVGNPGDIAVKLYAASGANPGTEITTATLSGSNPATTGNYAYACSGGGCALAANTTYFVVVSTPNVPATGSNRYFWMITTLDSETEVPDPNGWTVADDGRVGYSANLTGWTTSGGTFQIVVAATPKPTLTAGSVTGTTATLTITGQTGDWWLKKTAPTPAGACTAGEADYSHALSNLTEGTAYTYKAYSDSACTTGNEIASATFTPRTPTSLTASSVTATTATLTIAGHTGNWHYKADKAPDTTCSTAVSTTTKALTGLTAGTAYTYTAYANAACTTEIASETFTTPASLTASSVAATTATLTIAGRTGNWWLKETSPSTGTCTAGEADFSHALSTLTAGTTYTYKAYSDSSCTTTNELATETFTTTPGAPQNVIAQYLGSSLRVAWEKPSGAQPTDSFSYTVDCSTSTSAPYTWTPSCATIAATTNTNVSKEDISTSGVKRVRVRAVRSGANSAWVESAVPSGTAPGAPTNISSSLVSGGYKMTWSKPASPSGAVGYYVECQNSHGDSWSAGGCEKGGGTIAPTSGATVSTTVGYVFKIRVRAVVNGLVSGWLVSS